MMLEFDLDPVSASRPRVTRRTTFYEDPYRTFRNNMAILISMSQSIEILEKPIEMGFHFYMPMPKSWNKKKKREMLGQFHTQTPDMDNLIKAVKDCLTGHAYADDCHVASYSYARMEWSEKGRIVVELESLT